MASMGRGAHPASMADRLAWPLSPWARRRFVRAGIRLEPEVSFQGGDGYLFFGTDDLALATLTRFVELAPPKPIPMRPPIPSTGAPIFPSISTARSAACSNRIWPAAPMRARHRLWPWPAERHRQPQGRRQSDIASDRTMSLRQIRAIPHNAILQQLGYPVNIIAGAGSAAEGNYEELAALLRSSERAAIVRLSAPPTRWPASRR
jgi:phosphoenolpyruvate carboxylase